MILPILGVYLAFSLFTYIAYWIDKRAAQRNRSRIPEATLLALGAMGGWPGGLFAQQALRHKTKKLSFQLLFWLSVLLNIAIVIWLLQGGSGR